MKVLFNEDNDELYCTGCKERIPIGFKYCIITENYFGEKIEKPYHIDDDCIPEMEDDE